MESSILCYKRDPSESDVEQLLREWYFEELIPVFNEKLVDIETLKYLTLEDICVLIPIEYFSLRVKFRQKLFEWRQEMGYVPPLADQLLLNNTVHEWLNTTVSNTSPSVCSNTERICDEKPVQKRQDLDLKNILENSLTGRNILSKQTLTSFDRRKLVDIICENWINVNYFPKHADFVCTANEILTLFNKENKEIYIGTKDTRGTLVQKYYSLCKKFKSAGLVKSRYRSKKGAAEETVASVEIDLIDDNILTDFQWLKHNNAPEQLVLEKWNSTFKLRQNQRKQNCDLFSEWPILKQGIGSQLIELDFEREYPSKSAILYAKWDTFLNKIKIIYEKGIRDNGSKIILNKLSNLNVNQDSKDYYSTILLNAILIPTIIKEGVGSNKTSWKPTIADGQRGLVIFVKNIKDVPLEIRNRKDKLTTKKLTIHPFIVTVGDCEENIESSYIYYNDIFYECDSFLKALSLCFQLHQVLNIKYARECIQVWHFFEVYFFDFPVSGKKSNSLLGLISDLNI